MEADPGKAGYLLERCLEAIHQLQVALGQPLRLERVAAGKAFQGRGRFVDLGVVFHGAGAQRIEVGIDAEILLG